jgi:hypothetical protein
MLCKPSTLPAATERVLCDAYGSRVIVGPNMRGGFGFRFPGQPEMFGSYATMADVERCCATEGYTHEGDIKR